MELGTVQYSTLDCGVEKSCIGPELRTVLGKGISILQLIPFNTITALA